MSAAHDPAALSAAKRALLEQRLRGLDITGEVQTIPRRPVSAPVPLSAGQRRLWFLHQLAPESSAYTMFDALRLVGPVDAAALRAAVSDVVSAHEILRTRYVQRDGRPEAVIGGEGDFGFEVLRTAGDTQEARERQARSIALEFIRAPFDLAEGPVLRAALVRVADNDSILALAIHHIACDEWSLDIVWRQIAAAYADRRTARQRAAGLSGLQYADYVHWQETARPVGNANVEYWRRALADCPPPLELPADRVPPIRRSFRGGTVSGRVDGEIANRLGEIARGAGTTRFVLNLTAFLVLLHHYTGETDLVVGVPATGRSRAELEDVVGFFLNTLALRIDVAGDPSFRDLLRRACAVFLDGVTHRDAPFEAVVDAIAPERRLSRNPLFSVMLVEQAEPAAPAFGDSVAVSRYRLDGGGAKFDLTLFAGERDGGAGVLIEYDSDLFERTTAERMLHQYCTLLAAIAADPDRAISALPLGSPAEARLVQSWSRGPALAAAAPVHERFAGSARIAPDRIATIDEHGEMGYADLLRRADAIAARLHDRGVSRGDRVGICGNRSADLIAGILGILRARGAYVPLDPEYPSARLDFAMRDAGVRAVLVTTGHEARVAAPDRVVLPLDAGFHDAGALNVSPDVALDDAAYVIHTSGSTGAPKGVRVTHRNLAFSTAARDVTYPEPPGVFMLLSSFAFDSSVAGIFWTLSTGGTLALPPKRIEQDVHALAGFIRRHGVTHTLCLPSLWETILEHAPVAPLRSLRAVIVAGEACSARLVRRHYDTLPGVALWNEYGPTEATVWSTAYLVPPGFEGARVPIGRPVAGACVHVLGPNGEPAPIGVAGELWIGGAGVASYLDRPEDTLVRFAPDPFSADAGAQLYRTGDLARWRDDGLLEFLGRTDQQVKVRGYRIEPAEIESALRQHIGVRDVAVGVRALNADPARPADMIDRIMAALDALGPGEAERLLTLTESTSPVELSA